MAWVVWRTGRGGVLTAQVKWRDPDTRAIRSRALGPSTDETAEAARRHVEANEERRAEGPQAMGPRVALARFLSHMRFMKRSPETVRFYQQQLGEILTDMAGRAQMARWHRRHFEAYLREHPTWSPRTVQMRIYAARRFLKWAAGRVRVPDFVGDLRGPVVRTTETPHYTPAQVGALLQAMRGEQYELPIALACLAGLSLADLRIVRWEQVHPVAGVLTGVRHKTHVPYRVPILPALADVLKRHRPRSGRGLMCDLPPRADSARNVAVRACAAAGLTGGGWHRLRHSFGALLDQAGASLAEIRTAMGHSPASSVTLRYLHADDSRAGDVAAAAQAALDGPAKATRGRSTGRGRKSVRRSES